MTDVYNDYRCKSGNREDPRLSRRDSKSEHSKHYDKVRVSPKQSSTSGSSRDPRIRDHSWQTDQPQTQNDQYNASMQTAYQHLPPSMYTDHNQYSAQGYQTSYPAYQQNYVSQTSYNPYQGYNQTQPGYNSGTVQPGPPGGEYPQNEWAPVSAYPNMTQAPTHQTPVGQLLHENSEDHKKEAIAQELKHQKTQMTKQREEYVRKVSVLHRELDLLRNQKQELLADHSSEHDNNHILRENNKLQLEIQNKMKTICNVIDMLTNIIGDHRTVSELQELYMIEDSPKPRREKPRRSMSSDTIEMEAKYCYIYYDPELHWCRICDEFPKSAKEYLLHLHSKEHRQITQERDMVDTPWHKLPVEPEIPSYEGATKKRMPIKGLQFLISATSWYCKLCDAWVGDLHCASQHLKSQNHNYNYTNFVEQNPHWEIEWLRDRDKALARISKDKHSESEDSDNRDTKKVKKHSLSDNKKDKKKKKHIKKRKKHSSDSSSSSSSSYSSSDDETNDKSKSIRVAMRNKMKLQAQMIMNEDVGGKWEVLGRLVEEHKRKEASEMGKESGSEDNLINQWMTINEPQEKDKRLFDNLRDRMKQKQEAEKARLAEVEMKKREKEKKEKEIQERKDKEQQEIREKEEEKRRQQEELDRLREKEREQIRFKPREKYKRPSQSPERNKVQHSSSPNNDHRKREHNPEKHYRDNRYSENERNSSENRRHSPNYEKKDNSPDNKRNSHKHSDKDSGSRGSDSKKDKRYRGSSSYKKPHFIGRMPLFKNKKNEDKVEKEIKKEDYDIPRQSRFQPGNLARAFIPEPEVVCFPKLSSIPPLMIPPPPVVVIPPEPPKISENLKIKAPPPPIINDKKSNSEPKLQDDLENVPPPPNISDDLMQPEELTQEELNQMYAESSHNMGMDPASMMQYHYSMDYNAMMYSQMYDYSQDVPPEEITQDHDQIPIEHTMPLQPPPLPPDDPSEDLAMLGISADDMAAQMF